MKSTNENFISRLKRHKEDALEYTIDHYMPLVKTVATKILYACNNSDIEACINDVFMLVWQHSHRFEGDHKDFKKWIGTIAKYKAIDQYRQHQQKLQYEQPSEYLIAVTNPERTDTTVLNREKRTLLLVAINGLSEIDREIFLMKYYLELSNGEIAKCLHLSKAAVDNRLYRGKKVLATNTSLRGLYI